MTIYIHGFGGSGKGVKATLFRENFSNILTPSLSYIPDLAIDTLTQIIKEFKSVNLIGSSLGGYYATYLAQMSEVKKVVLINPSTKPTETLQKMVGYTINYYDLSKFQWQESHIRMLEKYQDNLKDYSNFLVLLQKGDELLDYSLAANKYSSGRVIIQEGGDHSFVGIERYFDIIKEFFM